jgi:multicomponent Na+:H+ antiporter subunit C
MSVDLALVLCIAVLVGCGTTLMLERSLSRILVGFVMVGNGVNLLFLVASGPSGAPPIVGREGITDPLPQAMALTAIVITLGVSAFGLALAYRSWQLSGNDDVKDDVEDDLVRRRAEADDVSGSFDEPEAEVPDEEGADR